MSKLSANRPSFGSLSAFAYWLLAYLVLWYFLASGAGWAFGIPSAVLASLVAVYLRLQPWRIRIRHLPSFLFFFLRSAVMGAADVARRSVQVRLPIAPAWVRYRFVASDSRVRLLVSAIIGLFPGTLASRIENDELHVHILDESVDWQSTTEKLEQKLMQLLCP